MGEVNANVIVFGIFLAVLILVLVVGGVFYLFSASRQQTRAKLESIQARYAPQLAKGSSVRRAFQAASEATTVESVLRQLMPKREVFRLRLAKTGRRISLVHYTTMILLVGLIAFFILFFVIKIPALLSLFLSVLAGLSLPHIITSGMIKRRISAFILLFPDTLDLIVRGLRSGLPITETINSVAKEMPDPIGIEFRKVMDNIRLGRDMDTALKEVAQRIEASEFKFFIITLAIQRETGGNLAETLAKLSDLLRRRQAMKLKIRAMASEGKASALIVGFLPFIMFGILLFINYSYTSVLFTDPRAILVSVLGLFWMFIGFFAISRMIAFEI